VKLMPLPATPDWLLYPEPLIRPEQKVSTEEEKYRIFQARLQALKSSTSKDKGAQKAILDKIKYEELKKRVEFLEHQKIDAKLSLLEDEYLEVIKAQEIMDKIDEKRKRDA